MTFPRVLLLLCTRSNPLFFGPCFHFFLYVSSTCSFYLFISSNLSAIVRFYQCASCVNLSVSIFHFYPSSRSYRIIYVLPSMALSKYYVNAIHVRVIVVGGVQAAGREDSSMNLRHGDMFIVRYRPIRTLVLEGHVDLIWFGGLTWFDSVLLDLVWFNSIWVDLVRRFLVVFFQSSQRTGTNGRTLMVTLFPNHTWVFELASDLFYRLGLIWREVYLRPRWPDFIHFCAWYSFWDRKVADTAWFL